MCGICGSVAFSGLPDPGATRTQVDAMLQALSHRGPDAVGSFNTDSAVLGATRLAVAGLLLRQSALLVLAGTAVGLGASAAVARLLATLTGQVNPLDGITLIAVAALLAVVGAAATLVPAFRAIRTDPVSALRTE